MVRNSICVRPGGLLRGVTFSCATEGSSWTRRGLLSLIAVLAGLLVAAGPDDEPKADDVLKLATFNIHFAEGADGALDLKRVADLVRGADIVAFQEVDVRFRPRSRFVDQAAALAKELGGHHVFGANLIEGEGQYGVALVSQFPISRARTIACPAPKAGRRPSRAGCWRSCSTSGDVRCGCSSPTWRTTRSPIDCSRSIGSRRPCVTCPAPGS